MKSKKSKTGCPDALSSNCVTWNGAEIPCLGVSNGDSMSEVVCDIANKVCKIAKDIDVSQADLSCILDLCTLCPEEKNLKSIIQLLLDNQCKLKDLIDNIDGGSADVTLNLNLRCLKKFDDFGNELTQDLNESLQSVVNELCGHKTSITTLQTKTNDLQDQIDNLPTAADYVEPTITTCLTPARRVSQAVPLIAQDYCTFKNLIGNSLTIAAAISQQCPDLNTEYQGLPGWQLSVDTLSKSINNLWVVACDIHSRIKNIEDNCCQITCDDIEVHYSVSDNEDGDGVTIHFSGLYGNKIPASFTDCGSSISFTDKNDKVVRAVIRIAQESTSPEFDLSGLDLTDIIKINLQVKLCSGTMTCLQCVETDHMVVNGSCAACAVVIAGTSGSTTIYYKLGTSQNSITGNVGDTVYVPKNAIDVSYIINSGDATPDTSCLTLTQTETTCYVIDWQEAATGVLADMYFDNIKIGMDELPLGQISYNTPDPMVLGNAINALNSPKVKVVGYRTVIITVASRHMYLILRVVGSDIPRVRIQNPSDVQPSHELYLIGETSDCTPEGFTEVTTVFEI